METLLSIVISVISGVLTAGVIFFLKRMHRRFTAYMRPGRHASPYDDKLSRRDDDE